MRGYLGARLGQRASRNDRPPSEQDLDPQRRAYRARLHARSRILVLNPCEICALNIPREQLGSEESLQLSFGNSVLLAHEPNLRGGPNFRWTLALAKESQFVTRNWTRCLTHV